MTLQFREAQAQDLESIIAMLADDELGAQREDYRLPLPQSYRDAFSAIEKDPNNKILVAEGDGELAGVMQLTLIPNLTYKGSWRAQIEGVRTHSSRRGQGVGKQLILYAIELAREKGCMLVQLTTDKKRPDALRFYENLGFVASHEGCKLKLI